MGKVIDISKARKKKKLSKQEQKIIEELESSPNKDYQSRILIVNNESQYADDLKKTIKEHSKGKADVDFVHIKDADSKLNENNVPYHAVILGGSFKRKYDSPEVQKVIKSVDKFNEANPDNQVSLYGTCLGHQALVHYHKGKVEDLGKYQKGQKKIRLKDNSETTTHKHHKWGVTHAPNLEVLADSEVPNKDGNPIKIIEAVEHKDKHYITSQGHPEREGHARELLYEFLDKVYAKGKKQNSTKRKNVVKDDFLEQRYEAKKAA